MSLSVERLEEVLILSEQKVEILLGVIAEQRKVLKMLAEVLPEDRSTIKTCYGVNNIHRDAIHRVLKLSV